MVVCHAEIDKQNGKEDNTFQGHISEAEANLKREDVFCTPDHFWLGVMRRHNVTANWYFLMPPSLLGTSLIKILQGQALGHN